ncbi:MAG: sigma-70 family RNA polymerase sigma factor [Nevskia sp.]|nr:sigma-70 family RNA polymerase sigma factor [Nevskia sp.]
MATPPGLPPGPRRHRPAPAAARRPLRPGLPSPAAGLDAYIQAVNRIPLLTRAEELRLARRLRDTHDAAAIAALALPNLRFVVSIARGFAGYRQPLADLIQEGNIGLIKAIGRFRPAAGTRLIQFAARIVRDDIGRFALRQSRVVPPNLTLAQQDLYLRLRRHYGGSLQMLRGEPLAAAAAALKAWPPDIRQLQKLTQGYDLTLARAQRLVRRGRAPADALTGTIGCPQSIGESEAWQRLVDGAHAVLATLDPRTRDIVGRRWLAPGKRPTLKQLARDYGISGERIRQIERRAFAAVRAMLDESR